MRGAAMKLGQILSMDSGDLLPRELADILATLRNAAYAMPKRQLDEVLTEAFGVEHQLVLIDFEHKPFAAASIGQVHRLRSARGQPAVLKIQYPGVRESIDSDVDNLVALLKVSGLLPKHMDISPLLTEVKAQLHEEADYKQEAKYLRAFVKGLGDDERFLLPRVIPSLSGLRVLGLTYVDGIPIEEVADENQEERDRVMSLLFELLLIELFELGLVQTDPNFANYRYNPETGQVVLLDFGASKYFPDTFTVAYLDLLASTIEGDRLGMAAAAETAGYSLGSEGSPYREVVLDLLELALEPISCGEAYDFGESTLPRRLADMGQQIQGHKEYWEVPPMYAAYIHRKIAGLFLLASRLKARVNIHELVLPWLD